MTESTYSLAVSPNRRTRYPGDLRETVHTLQLDQLPHALYLSVCLPVTLVIQITVTASNSYVTVSPSNLVFTSSDWDNTQTVTVAGVNDGFQTAESYTAALIHTASSTDALFDGTAPTFFPDSEVRFVTA